jgi:hypothetical protein
VVRGMQQGGSTLGASARRAVETPWYVERRFCRLASSASRQLPSWTLAKKRTVVEVGEAALAAAQGVAAPRR